MNFFTSYEKKVRKKQDVTHRFTKTGCNSYVRKNHDTIIKKFLNNILIKRAGHQLLFIGWTCKGLLEKLKRGSRDSKGTTNTIILDATRCEYYVYYAIWSQSHHGSLRRLQKDRHEPTTQLLRYGTDVQRMHVVCRLWRLLLLCDWRNRIRPFIHG